MNRCDISEEETTNALYALYQMPISEGQNNMQSHAAGTAIGASSVDAVQLDLNQKKSSSVVLSDRGQKKHANKEKTMTGINNYMINAQESGKNVSLTDMNQHPAESNPMKKTSSQRFSMFNNLIEEKHVAKEIKNGGTSFVSELIYCCYRFIFMV